MTSYWLGYGVLFAGYLGLIYWLDRPQHPAWHTRNRYRLLCHGLVLLLTLLMGKLLAFYTELTALMPYCR